MSDHYNPAENDLPQVPPAQASDNLETHDHLNGETTRANERENYTSGGADEIPTIPRSRKGRGARPARKEQPEQPDASSDSILRMPVRSAKQPAELSEESDKTVAVAELEAQGFTADEAARLIDVSGRVATSHEAREAEATLRRLRFTRWLVERGVLDEFSA